jgi:ribosomal protein S18 acetylase RimI-like enzyme
MATARKRLAKNFQFRLDGRTIGPYNARQDGPEAAARDRLQPCALRSPSGSRERKKKTAEVLKQKTESTDEIELLAEVDGAVVGSAGIGCVGRREKTRHRARFGISVDKAYWGLGIGRAMTEACIECAKTAGYVQLELEAVAENEHALALYRSVGFAEYGRNPKGFRSRISGWQAVVLMRLEL